MNLIENFQYDLEYWELSGEFDSFNAAGKGIIASRYLHIKENFIAKVSLELPLLRGQVFCIGRRVFLRQTINYKSTEKRRKNSEKMYYVLCSYNLSFFSIRIS